MRARRAACAQWPEAVPEAGSTGRKAPPAEEAALRCRSCTPVPEEVRRAAGLLERRWTVSILFAAHGGAVRFNEFRQSVGPIPPATLAARLSELEEAGIVERIVRDTRPPSVEYRLTPVGRKLQAVVDAIGHWAAGTA